MRACFELAMQLSILNDTQYVCMYAWFLVTVLKPVYFTTLLGRPLTDQNSSHEAMDEFHSDSYHSY